MNDKPLHLELIDFLRASPTPYHAVLNLATALQEAGFQQLRESQQWQLDSRGRYYVMRGGSSLIAFRTGDCDPVNSGFRMVGAHTDSPALKIKPHPEISKHGYLQLGVEVYGSALLNPWFDRDLSIAGRVTARSGDRAIQHLLVDFQNPVAMIPNLAIHLDRDANENHPINPQKHLPAIVMHTDKQDSTLRQLLSRQLSNQYPDVHIEEVLDFDLYLYDTQPPSTVGLNGEFIASARLDNLLSCFVAARSLMTASDEYPCLLVCNDHEEVGSMSAVGAQGPFLRSVLLRWCGDAVTLSRATDRSMLVSADNAHGIHPNYADKHDENHGPILNRGPVIKVNANQRYASTSETSALFRQVCSGAGVPVQAFVTRTDLACGSTIGPITASEIGVKTLDVGVPQFAMHSVRELCGARDVAYLHTALSAFYNEKKVTVE